MKYYTSKFITYNKPCEQISSIWLITNSSVKLINKMNTQYAPLVVENFSMDDHTIVKHSYQRSRLYKRNLGFHFLPK